jgi:hypothetical protein
MVMVQCSTFLRVKRCADGGERGTGVTIVHDIIHMMRALDTRTTNGTVTDSQMIFQAHAAKNAAQKSPADENLP